MEPGGLKRDELAAAELAAMQFAGGRSIGSLAEEWDRSPAWVEEAIRRALLKSIPVRDGGEKPLRAVERAERREAAQEAEAEAPVQEEIRW